VYLNVRSLKTLDVQQELQYVDQQSSQSHVAQDESEQYRTKLRERENVLNQEALNASCTQQKSISELNNDCVKRDKHASTLILFMQSLK
jgi:predicted S18 family serine protease